ncbi:PIN domain-containing protein [Agrobacterium vitis]|uniref:PIN domain-containing protein n=1 Tax=Agrobacterium vitis TaxID=373 RepID=A0ABD6GBJ2_AGRVI|nr:type II toxin-antitoxin system VapC family toxin [Agrobacterium vitis]MUO81142.1 PIN domain-containing protein [Agrobacterium vitis]MUO95700.1 PIN domain-containing protein [Agrobacterium vitis]MUP06823.1 PIN domain-containing protein [Agrobacterium vitis]MUZ84603.1 PIN domain-containing protein [Agrobacterium vitis]MVA10512.1 PIN domain-containing protein [Agrobacterium vitis]
MGFMLDTNIVSDMVRNPDGPAMERWKQTGYADLHLSAIVVSELYFGIQKHESERLRRGVETFLNNVEIAAFEGHAAHHYTCIRNALAKAGEMIGPNDLFIAAHALSLDMVLVTNNSREFSRVSGLKLENWLETTHEGQ